MLSQAGLCVAQSLWYEFTQLSFNQGHQRAIDTPNNFPYDLSRSDVDERISHRVNIIPEELPVSHKECLSE